ncbi:MAG: glycosyltransferase, partial [Patescibacteria group bacterium]
MKVGLDLRCLPSDGSLGAGVAHAARALCSQLIKDKSVDWVSFFVKGASFPSVILSEMSSTNEVERSGPFLKPDSSTTLRYAQNDSMRIIELADGQSKTLRIALKDNPCDVLFVPSGAVSFGIDIPAVPWVHDLIIFDNPEWFAQSWLQRQFTTRIFLRGIKRAPVVFAVSEYTKQAIIRHALVSQDKVIVTYEGGDTTLRLMQNAKLIMQNADQDYCMKKFGIERAFVLALGTVEPRKNLAMLIRAWKTTPSIKGGRGDFDLVIAGRNGWKFEDVNHEIESFDAESRQHFHRLENISDDDKRQLLLAASTVAVPSL